MNTKICIAFKILSSSITVHTFISTTFLNETIQFFYNPELPKQKVYCHYVG
jgi:hypothetical protein